MADFKTCNLCAHPGNFDNATEVKPVRSNVRMFQDETFTVWRCSRCGSLHSKESVCLENYYRHYPINNHRMDGVTRLAYQNRLRALQKYGVGKGAKLLDYGCGHGVFISFLIQCGYE